LLGIIYRRRNCRRPMLLVVPVNLIPQWKSELDYGTVPKIHYMIYDKNVGVTPREMKSHELILTTYHMVKRDFDCKRKAEKAIAESCNQPPGYATPKDIHQQYPLQVVELEAVLGDEVGTITNLEAGVTQAMMEIQTERRVGATGTPVRNDYSNLHALISWLKIEPWDDEDLFRRVSFDDMCCSLMELTRIQYFVNRPNGRGKAKPLTGLRNAVLAVSLRPHVLRLDYDDKFNGRPVLPHFPNCIQEVIKVELQSEEEIAIQDISRWQ